MEFELEGTIEETEGFNPLPYLDKVREEIKPFSMGFYLEETSNAFAKVASGTLVNAQGFYGFLTAHHVAVSLLKRDRFGLSIATHIHELWVEPKQIEHVPIGENPNESVDGPDLSFLIIRDVNLLSILKSKKSFRFLDRENPAFIKQILHSTRWLVSGCPLESMEPPQTVPSTARSILEFIGSALFKRRIERNGFDFLEMELPNKEAWPICAEGMSGGGLWLAPIGYSPDNPAKLRHGAPILAGVNYYQMDRALHAHGPDSIYKCVIQSLKGLGESRR